MGPPRWPIRPSIRHSIRHSIPLVVLATLAAGATAADRSPGSVSSSVPRCAAEPTAPVDGVRSGGWWRLDPVLDEAGALVGQDLHAGGSDGRRYRIGLPPESFASGPLDGLVLIGADDGSSSLLSILDLWAGCRHPVATETAVVRRATIGPDATAVYEFRVDRRSRADLGIWRRDLGVDGEPTQVLGALPTDDRFGLTWTTEFDWSDDGRLIVGSCGAAACRSRVFDPIDGSLISIEEPDLGETLGLLDGQLVSYLACRGLPCPVVAIDLIEGTRRVLAPAAGLATVVDDGGAGTLVHELVDRPGIIDIVSMTGASLRTIDLGGSRRLVASGARSGSAIDLPPGWLPVGPGGRISPVGRADGVRIRDGRITPAGEVIR